MTEAEIRPLQDVSGYDVYRGPFGPAPYEELAWFATAGDYWLGLVLRDRADDDFSWVLFSRDDLGVYRAIDLEVSHPTVDVAAARLYEVMRKAAQ